MCSTTTVGVHRLPHKETLMPLAPKFSPVIVINRPPLRLGSVGRPLAIPFVSCGPALTVKIRGGI